MAPPSSSLLTATATPPQGFALIKDAVPEESWRILQTWLETNRWDDSSDRNCAIPWQIGAQNRRVAQFGFQYDYINDRVDTTSPTPPIPRRLRELLNVEPHFSQCIINEYGPNVLIPWHMDDLDFGPIISVFTFGESRPLLLKKKGEDDEQQPQQPVSNPDLCSKYILQGSARYEWEHMVPVGKGARVSFTFRTYKDEASR